MRVLKFHAGWCLPCKALSKRIEQLGDKVGLEVVDIDIDSDFEHAAKYKVRSVPTLIKVNAEGEEQNRVVGLLSNDDLLEFLGK